MTAPMIPGLNDAEMEKLLETGRTTLLKGFVSSRTRRKFSAYLVRGADGKVGFEFAPRAAAADGKAAPPSRSYAAKKVAAKKVTAKKVTARKKPAAR